MGRSLHPTRVSLDGFTADPSGSSGFPEPDDEVHASVDDSLRPIGTHLYGRRLHDVMVFRETVPDDSSVPPVTRDSGRVWRRADEVVRSRTLDRVATTRTTLAREFDPDAVRRRETGSDAELLVGGAELGGHALRAELVDEVRPFVFPVLVGGGLGVGGDVRERSALREERRFRCGVVHLRYDVVQGG